MLWRRLALLAVVLTAVPACGAKGAEEQGPSMGSAVARANLYACEGCEAVHERPADILTWRTVVASPAEPGERLTLRGIVYRSDGRTPAPGVVIYAHQTNAAGVYAGGTGETEWSRRHGRLRGWVKTGPDGRYEFDTIKPAPYPTHSDPAHIHLTVLEPDRRPYYIDDVVFDGEYGVDSAYRRTRENRGGSGIVKLRRLENGSWLASRDIVLERHP